MDIHESARCKSVDASGLFRRMWAFAAVLGQVADPPGRHLGRVSPAPVRGHYPGFP